MERRTEKVAHARKLIYFLLPVLKRIKDELRIELELEENNKGVILPSSNFHFSYVAFFFSIKFAISVSVGRIIFLSAAFTFIFQETRNLKCPNDKLKTIVTSRFTGLCAVK